MARIRGTTLRYLPLDALCLPALAEVTGMDQANDQRDITHDRCTAFSCRILR